MGTMSPGSAPLPSPVKGGALPHEPLRDRAGNYACDPCFLTPLQSGAVVGIHHLKAAFVGVCRRRRLIGVFLAFAT